MTDQLNEVFDSESIYPTTNLTPKAKVPQIIHIQAPGTNDIVVRLTSSDTIGTRVKAVKPGDKAVQVFLTSMSDKGNITDFKGGLGSDPIGALNTIFDTVIQICKEYRIESILFRFPKSKMKGKDQVAQRVIKRLTKTRSGGRFTTLDEIDGLSKKFAFALLYKKGKVLEDIPGIPNIDPAKFEKVETKVGETYVDKESGKSVSKSEAIAQTVADAADKTTQQQVVAITKVSRKAIMAILFSPIEDQPKIERKPKAQELYDLTLSSSPVVAANAPESKLTEYVLSANWDEFANRLKVFGDAGNQKAGIATGVLNFHNLVSKMNDTFSYVYDKDKKKEREARVHAAFSALGRILEGTTAKNLQDKLVKIAEHFSSGEFSVLPKDKRSALMHQIINGVMQETIIRKMQADYANDTLLPKGRYSPKQMGAVIEYTGGKFKNINEFLLGTSPNDDYASAYIPELDSIFESAEIADRLPKGTMLYRGQRLDMTALQRSLDNKVMYFKNYVSTALIPIFYGQFASVSATLDAAAVPMDSPDMNTFINQGFTMNQDGKDFYNTAVAQDKLSSLGRRTISLGLVIKGADKINVIVPGSNSSYKDECEVILPRGLLMRIGKVTSEAKFDVGEEWYSDGTALMELTIVDPSQLTESDEVIDGNLFLNEGTEKPVGLFSSMYKSVLTESVISTDNDANALLLSCMDFDSMPEKFK